jgi:predicted transposase/invertase (TIGR01784 family)
MKLFSLTVDFAFKALFAPNPDLLMDLINAFPAFQGENKVINIKILNPEIPKKLSNEKLSILDIKAENEKGEHFLIEMQAFPQGSFRKRVLYYWSKVYSRNLEKGKDYDDLKKVYSINFLKESIWKDKPGFLSSFFLMEVDTQIRLTEDLEIHIIELDKFIVNPLKISTDLDGWVYLLKESHNLKGDEMKTLEKKSPTLKKAITELKNLSRSPESREIYEARRKAELDYNSGIQGAYRSGLDTGKIEGKLETARMMKSKGASNSLIMEYTGLSEDELKQVGI